MSPRNKCSPLVKLYSAILSSTSGNFEFILFIAPSFIYHAPWIDAHSLNYRTEQALISDTCREDGEVYQILTLTTRGIGFIEQNYVCFLKILTFHRLFQELLNQYQACWYLSTCIFHCGSKYSPVISQF